MHHIIIALELSTVTRGVINLLAIVMQDVMFKIRMAVLAREPCDQIVVRIAAPVMCNIVFANR
jgi:hypothetical protein